ncbi:MAG: magnesium transporter CorA family protein [Patescibacteria group bacterium]|jgi:magnesium transporter
MEKPKHIHLLRLGGFQWFNVTQNTLREINWLKKSFPFYHTDVQDCLPPTQRPKLVEHDEYLFMVLLFPIYNRKTREIKATEVDFFIGRNFIVTIHDGQLPPLREFFTRCEKNPKFYQEIMEGGSANLLFEILNRLTNYCFPMLVHINNDIDAIGSQIFIKHGPKTIYEIALIKKNIINFRRTMQAHKSTISHLVEASDRFFLNDKIDIYFKNLIDQLKEIWDLLETHKETINSLHETRMSLSSYRLNQIIKTLTIISVLFAPMNLVAFIFAMRTPHPLEQNDFGFWIILGIMALIALTLGLIFRKKRWW